MSPKVCTRLPLTTRVLSPPTAQSSASGGKYCEVEDTKLKMDTDPLLSSAQDLHINLYAYEPGDHRDQHSAIMDFSALHDRVGSECHMDEEL